MYRTDRGEGYVMPGTEMDKYEAATYKQLKEWNGQANSKSKDKLGDDDVLISISESGVVSVDYMKEDRYANK